MPVSGVDVAAVGVLTAWGEGVAALPRDAREAARGRRIVAITVPPRPGERFRRATRECVLAVGGVEALLRDGGLDRDAIRGDETALLYVTTGAYGASNRAFIEGGGATALHFPYTAPSAVPAEVAIEFGVTGPYTTLIGGATATLEAIRQAARLVDAGACARALVLAVETFAECEALYARARWLASRPLVESTACALVVRGSGDVRLATTDAAEQVERLTRRRAGETLACAPLIALALSRESGASRFALTGEWRRRRLALTLEPRGDATP